ncbi:MAG: hypothetical protein M3Z85_20015, partial [Acidobacteriota bacterium]|nr:hypothetical protein [Acidobacteriota bacterium]
MFPFRFLPIVLLAWLLACVARGGELHREGSFWVETIEGSETVATHGKLRIVAPGSVVFRGREQSTIIYSLKRRVRAVSEVEAQAALRGYRVRSFRHGDTTSLTISDPERNAE